MRPQSTPLQPFLFPMKQCSGCGTDQPLCYFNCDRSRKDGLRSCCKACQSKQNARRLTKRPRRLEPMGMKWCPGCDRLLSQRAFWHDAHKADGLFAHCKQCGYQIRRAYYLAHRSRELAAAVAWHKAHPNRMRQIWAAHRARRRRIMRRTAKGTLDYDAIWARDQGMCHLCRGAVKGDDVHFDHIIPLSKGGTHTMDNIAVSHATCNLRKGARLLGQ